MSTSTLDKFLQAFKVIEERSSMIADYYLWAYWDDAVEGWAIERIDDKALQQIQKDAINLTSL